MWYIKRYLLISLLGGTTMYINDAILNAYKVLEGETLSRQEAIALTQIPNTDVLDLVSLANKVRAKFAQKFGSCSIINAKSGVCSQNCKFCAQSGHHNTEIETYSLLDKAEVLENVEKVYRQGVRSFGYVTSGYGYLEANDEFMSILDTLDAMHEKYPDLKLCVSIGILSDKTAKLLSEHHVWRYNMNLQTNPAKYKEFIADTHNIDDKIATIKYLQKYGVTNCTGGIFGLGESWEDRVDMGLAIRELNVEGIPLNVLIPIKGTKLENSQILSPIEVAKAFAIFRLLNPTKMIKFAAGRETNFKDFQGLLMLAGANAVITGGYLTTRGRSIEEDQKFLAQLEDFGV